MNQNLSEIRTDGERYWKVLIRTLSIPIKEKSHRFGMVPQDAPHLRILHRRRGLQEIAQRRRVAHEVEEDVVEHMFEVRREREGELRQQALHHVLVAGSGRPAEEVVPVVDVEDRVRVTDVVALDEQDFGLPLGDVAETEAGQGLEIVVDLPGGVGGHEDMLAQLFLDQGCDLGQFGGVAC